MFCSDSTPPGRSASASIAIYSLCFESFNGYLDRFSYSVTALTVMFVCCLLPWLCFLPLISYPDFLCFAFVAPWHGVCFLGVGFCFRICHSCVCLYLSGYTDVVFLLLSCPDSVLLLRWLLWQKGPCIWLNRCPGMHSVFLFLDSVFFDREAALGWLWRRVSPSLAALTVCFNFGGCPDSVF
jgi:hypothetical protein